MIITAKYASICPGCSGHIDPGSKVEWIKGAPARHVACAGATTSTTVSRIAPARKRGARYCEGWGADNPHAPRPPYTCDECE